MSRNKRGEFQHTIWEIQRRWGTESISVLSKFAATHTVQHIPTGFPALDAALEAQGIRRRHVTQVIGVPTSGMTTLVLTMMGQVQRDGEGVVYIELGANFNADYAARRGIDLSSLFICRPASLQKAFDLARDLLSVSGLALIVINGVMAQSHSSSRFSQVTTVAHQVQERLTKSRAAVLFLGGATLPSAFDHMTDARLFVQRTAWLYHHADIRGYQIDVQIQQAKAMRADSSITLDLYFDKAVYGDGA